MKLQKLTCNSCGAPIDVPESAKYVTCNHCSAQLVVHRRDNVTFTEQLKELADKTEELSQRVDDLTDQGEVAALDREWEFERERYMITTKNGGKHVPTEAGAIGGGVAITLFGCVWLAMAIGITSSAPDVGPFVIAKVAFPLFGLVFIVSGIVMSMNSYSKAGDYRAAERRYKSKRSELLRREDP